MLQVKNICKEYRTGSLVQKALDNVSLNLRDSEFVAILGPSGSGKTTLLNIIGGLDRYDSGDLIINGISTKKYKDRDWDSYRNHTIGFVFQSYNLIPHQTVLANVELALTISGISRSERRQRAVKALEEVGLGNQLHKKPGQMSGGQMQRVAIARALVNNPDILLADEPTGALDSATSIQVMDLLKDVAKDRLVVMVTHNPELAQNYATRIVTLKDGQIRADSDPFEVDERTQAAPIHKNMGKASMSFRTALSLSFNNLCTKKGRTILTAFAGSIGIIGIALILSLSNGVNEYIRSIEQDTLSEYPLQIQNTGMNFSSMMSGMTDNAEAENTADTGGSGEVHVAEMLTSMFSTVDTNDLASLKEFLESGESGMEPYARAIEYGYDVTPRIYRIEEDGDVRQVNPDQSLEPLGLGASSSTSNMMSSMMSTNVFYEMPANTELYQDQYEVRAGRWPESYQECVVVLTPGGSISDFLLYTLGLRDAEELDQMVEQFAEEEKVATPDDIRSYSYDELLGITFKLVNDSDFYEYDSQYQMWRDRSDNEEFVKNLVANGEDLTIVGVVQPAEGTVASMLSSGIGYPAALTEHIIQESADSTIVREQLANPDVNVLTGNTFGEDNSQSNFDLASIFQVDEEALANAFQFDESALSLDLSGLSDLSGMMDFSSLELPELSGLDLGSILGQADFSVSSEELTGLAGSLLAGYQSYAEQHPEADYSQLGEHFTAYLQTPEARQRLAAKLQEFLEKNPAVSLSAEAVEQLIVQVMGGFQQWAAEQGITSIDPSRFSEYLSAYLSTPGAQQILAAGVAEILENSQQISISSEELEAFAADLLAGYQEYAAANGLPDPSRMGEHFSAYLSTPEAQQQLSTALASMMESSGLTDALSSALEEYMGTMMASVMSQLAEQLGQSLTSSLEDAMSQLGDSLQDAFQVDEEAFANAIQVTMTEEELSELLMSLMTAENASYSNNLRNFGYADMETPSEISIYPLDFESKASIVEILDGYNTRMEESGQDDKVITYTDMVGTLMSSVTDIIDIISYVLVAFVSISLIVSSIMIGILTYTSVLERKKEIGILRAIGASKRNVAQVFNAETFIIGLAAGLVGICMTLLILIPGNALIHSLTGEPNINAALPFVHGAVLVVLSVILTLIGGLFPARKAAKNDPVTALRTE